MASRGELKAEGIVKMLQEFKEFAMKGNVVDLAIGVIIGAAFGKIVESLVADVIMPMIGMFGSVDFSNLYVSLGPTVGANTSYADAKKLGPMLGYGQFLTLVVNFVIIAWVLFLVVKAMNRMKKQAPPAPVAVVETPADIKLLTEIRDALRK
jgi:large conductance mechanosensitive channel